MKQQIIQHLQLVREKRPLVHNITNFVVMNSTANTLLAVGASPIMAHAHDEIEEMVNIAGALVINIGTLDEYWAKSMLLAAKQAHDMGKPWILDPVGAGASRFRNETIAQLLAYKPTVIRGNASEILAINIFDAVQGKGVDSLHQSHQAIQAAKAIHQHTGAIVCISGASDFVVSQEIIYEVRNGAELMTRITGTGCSSTATIGAFIALNDNPLIEALSGLAVFSLAGEMAKKVSNGPGSLQMNIFDCLYCLSAEDLEQHLQVAIYEA